MENGHFLDNLPLSLKQLKIRNFCITTNKAVPLDHLPLLTHLHLEFQSWDIDLNYLPVSLQVVKLGRFVFSGKLDKLPSSIQQFSLRLKC